MGRWDVLCFISLFANLNHLNGTMGRTTVYFTDPYSSWQKGSIENANGLIRQYIPKSSPIKHLKDKDIDEITAKINTRPRKKLNFSTPIEEFLNYLL